MDPPQNLTILFNEIKVKVPVVTDLEKSGMSPVIKYRVQWDNYQFYNPEWYPNNIDGVPWVTLGDIN